MQNYLNLSHKGIKDFNSCKALFKNLHIDKIHVNKSKNNKFFSFDRSIHSALAEFNYKADYTNKSYIMYILDKNWISLGYSSIYEELAFKNKAYRLLLNYINTPLDMSIEILSIDSYLKRKVNKYITLTCKIDKLHEISSNVYEVVDYKTGKHISPISKNHTSFHIPILLDLIYDKFSLYPNYISYYYLQFNKKISYEITSEVIKKSKKLLKSYVNEIKKEELFICDKYPCNNLDCNYFKYCKNKKL